MEGEQQVMIQIVNDTIQIVTDTMPAGYWMWTSVIVPIVIAWFGYKVRMKMLDKKK